MEKQIKVLWLSNIEFSNSQLQSTGTWLSAMGNALQSTKKIELFNITQSKRSKYTQEAIGSIKQWLVPFERFNKKGLPSLKTINYIQRIVEEVRPEIIHVWGTENYWGLLTARGYINGNILLETQGLRYACAKVYYGGLTFSELLKCIGLKEILNPGKSIFAGKIQSERWGKFEIEILKAHKNISTQSDWIRAHVFLSNQNCKIHRSEMMLRNEFTESAAWNRKNLNPIIFTSSAGSRAYKGIHVLFKALSILKQHYPTIVLQIAGSHLKGIKTSGYSKFLMQEALRLGISNSIQWLGSLDSTKIVSQLHSSSVVVIPSFVESYSMSLAEAMIVGTPIVVAYSGAMTELAVNNESALFYTAGDEVMCAHQIEKVLEDHNFALNLSKNARIVGLLRNNTNKVIEQQLSIYNSLLEGK